MLNKNLIKKAVAVVLCIGSVFSTSKIVLAKDVSSNNINSNFAHEF